MTTTVLYSTLQSNFSSIIKKLFQNKLWIPSFFPYDENTRNRAPSILFQEGKW